MFLNYMCVREVITVSKDTALCNILRNITKLHFISKLLSQKMPVLYVKKFNQYKDILFIHNVVSNLNFTLFQNQVDCSKLLWAFSPPSFQIISTHCHNIQYKGVLQLFCVGPFCSGELLVCCRHHLNF